MNKAFTRKFRYFALFEVFCVASVSYVTIRITLWLTENAYSDLSVVLGQNFREENQHAQQKWTEKSFETRRMGLLLFSIELLLVYIFRW